MTTKIADVDRPTTAFILGLIALLVIAFVIPESRQWIDDTAVATWQGLEHAIVAIAAWITNLF